MHKARLIFRGKPPPKGHAFLPSMRFEMVDYQLRIFMGEITARARCPVCRHPLVAHVGRKGPAFRCACPTRDC
jgi:hypothetical protein